VTVRRVSRFVAYTWSRQWPAEALMGVTAGALNLAGFCALRCLGAPDATPQWFTILGQALWMLAPAWPLVLARMERRHAFLWIGLLSKGPLLVVAAASVVSTGAEGRGVGDWLLFVAMVVLYLNADAIYTPHRNALMRANYPLVVRGRVFGLVGAVVQVASILSSLGVAWLVEHDARWVRVVFPAAAVVGIVAHVLYARIRWRFDGPRPAPAERGLALVRASLSTAWRGTGRTLREDKAFRDYEIGFMLYGLGLLATTPLIVTFAERTLHLSPVEWGGADRVALPVTQLLLIPFVGWFADRVGIVRVTGLSFGLLSVFFLAMTQVGDATSLTAVYVLYGLCMAGVNLGWSVGPLHFAPQGQAHHYAAVHVACVGFRSVAGPLLGWAVQAAFSFRAALLMSAVLEAAGAVWMLALARRVHVR
jgi:MFS family permease